jgi:hydroxylaminobenzene mutase
VSDTPQLQRRLALNAAVLLLLGLLTGFYVAGAMTGKLPADGSMALSAHLNALMGCFWMAAVAFTLPMTRFSPAGQARLVWLVTVPNYANWAITCLKAWWKVKGIDAVGEGHNDVIFGLLNAFVVLPALAAAGVWVWGLAKKPALAAGAPKP